jgi:hypothetical protein
MMFVAQWKCDTLTFMRRKEKCNTTQAHARAFKNNNSGGQQLQWDLLAR